MTLRQVRTAHLYLGLFLAPLLIFFSLSGAWQALDLHKSPKDGSYVPPSALVQLSEVHVRQRIGTQPGSARSSEAFKWMAAAAGIAVTVLATLGLVMAVTMSRRRWLTLTLLAVGIALPVVLLVAGGA